MKYKKGFAALAAQAPAATRNGKIEEKSQYVTQGVWNWNSIYDDLNQVYALAG